MSVTQTHMAASGFDVALRDTGMIADVLGRVNPYDHIAIVPKALDVTPNLRNITNVATFVGRLDQIEADGGSVVLSGPGIAVWLGDGSGRGAFPSAALSNTDATVANHLANNMPPLTNGLRRGVTANLQTAQVRFRRDRFVTWRQAFDNLSEQCDVTMEWRVNPNGTVDIDGFSTTNRANLIFQFQPSVVLTDSMTRMQGQSLRGDIAVIPADIGVSWDFSQFAARGVAVGRDSTTIRTPANQKPTLAGFGFDPTVALDWDVVVDAELSLNGQLDALALTAARAASVQRQWSVSAGDSELARLLRPGDWVWVHTESLPGVGSMTIAEEQSEWAMGVDASLQRRSKAFQINVAGRSIHPAKARVAALTWPISSAWDVFLLSTFDGSADVLKLSPYVEYEPEGPVDIDCNAPKPQWQLQTFEGDMRFRRSSNINRNVRASRTRFV